MSSLLISALPASVQSRIPRIPSLRRTMSVQSLFSRSDTTLSPPISLSASTAALATAGPLPSLPSALASPPPTPSSSSSSSSSSPSPSSPSSPSSSAAATASVASDTSSPLPSLPPSRPSTAPGLRSSHAGSGSADDYGLVFADCATMASASASPSQINWKYAQHGFRSLQNAAREAGNLDRLPALERQMYVESVAYLLRGLPSDLGGGELSQLRHAAPDHLVTVEAAPASASAAPVPVHVQVYQNYPFTAADEWMPSHPGFYTVAAAPPPPRRTLPHRATHWLITWVYGLVLALLPIAVRVAHWALEMQRKYHISEAALRWAAALAALVYRRALELYVVVCAMGDGSIKRALDDGTAYLASGVAAGFHEAVLDVARGQL